jgi:hypothetical protein
VYFPAPLGPERTSECGKRPEAIAARSESIAGLLPRKASKLDGRVATALTMRLYFF